MSSTVVMIDQQDLEQALDAVVRKVVAERAEDVWLDVKQAAKYLSLSDTAMRQAIRKGEVPVHRLGTRIRLSKAELNKLLAESA